MVSEGLHLVLEIPRTQSSCCWHGLIERSGLHHWTTHSEEILDFLQSCFRTTGTSQHVLPCHFVWEFVWSGFCMGKTEGHSSRFCERMNEKNPTLERVSGFRPTESLTALTFSGDLAVNFLPLVDFCPFLVDFINVPVSLNFFTQRVIWNLWGKLLKLNLLRYLA